MASSIDSTIQHSPSGEGLPDFDAEKTVIRQGELLELPKTSQDSAGPLRNIESAPAAETLLGKQLDHFLIETLIGTGGMGAVYKGRDLRLDREVAIKVVPIADRGAEAMRRFRFEAQSAAKLDHPNIARVYYVGETEQWSYIVFEFVEGTNLRDLVMRQGPLSIDDSVCLTRQVAEALQHAFERKVVHRDIKPSNILVTQTGRAKLVDMGLARNTELDKSTNDLTASGVTLGTFDYISPEQAHDPRNADVRSDIYSLGCTLYYLLTGQPPFPEGTALQKLLLHGSKLPDDPRHFRSDISDSMISILRKMMAKKPVDRYQEPSDLIHDFRTLAELEGLSWARASDTAVALPTASQRTWLEASVPLLVALTAILGIGSWQWMDSISYQNAVFAIPREEIEEIPDEAIPSQSFKSAELVQDGNAPNTENKLSPVGNVDATQTNKTDIKIPEETAAIIDTIYVNPLSFQEKDRSANVVRTMEQALEMAGNQPQIKRVVVRGNSITTTMNGKRWALDIGSDLVIQSEPGMRCKWVIDQAEGAMDSTEPIAFIDCFDSQLTLQDLDIEWRISGNSRRKALFAAHPGTWLQFKNTSITAHDVGGSLFSGSFQMTSKRSIKLPAVISIMETQSDNTDESYLDRLSKPARIFASDFSVRGQCDWMQHRSSIRTEVKMENGWLAIAGSMFETSGVRTMTRSSVPLRVELQELTSYSVRPFMVSHVSNASPFPTPIVRTAKDCVFSGCTSLIEWNATDCSDWKVWDLTDEGQRVTKWIDFRGRDNTYDDSWLLHYLTVRFNSGAVEQLGLDSSPMLDNDDERGLETEAAWIKRPTIDANRIHEATADIFEWMPRSFRPGYKPRVPQ
jgi:eukaryotic-like serine/threonine-protein kinase